MIKVFVDGKSKKLNPNDERFLETHYVDWIWSQFDDIPVTIFVDIQTWEEIEFAAIQLWALRRGKA